MKKEKKAWGGEKHENERLAQQEQMESRDKKKKTPQDPLGDPDFYLSSTYKGTWKQIIMLQCSTQSDR